MNKLLLTLGTVLLISGCSKEPNIDLNCIAGGGDSNFLFTIDTAKKESPNKVSGLVVKQLMF